MASCSSGVPWSCQSRDGSVRHCPFGDCAASHSDSDSDSDSEEDDEDEEEEEEVLENLTCAQLKQRLRAINKPVGGRKAELIQRIREHERLTAALFEED